MFTASCISNGIGIAMMLMLIITNREHIRRNRLTKYLFRAVIITLLSCMAEIIGFAADGRQGMTFTVILYICDSWLFFSVILITYLWLVFVCCLTENSVSRVMHGVILGIDLIGTIGMILLDRSKRRDEVVIRFSAGIFLAPVVAGVIAQSLLFGISVIWVSVAIAIQGISSYLKNSLIFMDSLTGVFNHMYLKDLEREYDGKDVAFTAFMTDFNDFKSINDDFGHGEGDQALIATSRIFSNAVVGRGRVIRCAGDEFVLIIRSVYEAVIQDVIEKIERGFEEYNTRNKLNYTLSASMGQAVFDSYRQTFRDFLGILDRKMYENKRKHYENDEYDRRKQLPLR